MINVFREHLKLLVCPDCKENLKKIEVMEELIGFYCPKCEMVYPIKHDIPILLSKKVRSYSLEYSLMKEIENKLSSTSFSELHKYIKKTLVLIMSKKDVSTWEWEDEKFWSGEYAREKKAKIPKNWNDRIWQKENITKELTNRLNLKAKTILDIGCGEGQNFRYLLKNHCDKNSLYIAADISFTALILNRLRNMHKNSLYVLCSVDDELPFSNNVVDVLCYFGILHHTKNKSSNIKKDKKLLRRNGYIILTESIDRPILQLSFLRPKAETSAHEEYINKKHLLIQLEKNGFKTIFVKEEGTPFFTAIMTLFREAMLSNKKLFLFISNVDILILKTLGRIIPFFRAGEIQLLARRSIDRRSMR